VVGRRRKLLERILSGRSDRNIPFDRTRTALRSLGFTEDVEGDHHIFRKEGVRELIDIQPTREAKVKPYQVAQIRKVLLDYGLAEEGK
jgi:hypothetical protein